MTTPIRVQRKRTKGWQAPLCGCGCDKPARYVGRGSSWGNPVRVARDEHGEWLVIYPNGMWRSAPDRREAAFQAVSEYRGLRYLSGLDGERNVLIARTELGGHDLMCWCPLDQSCHADVLLRVANSTGDYRG